MASSPTTPPFPAIPAAGEGKRGRDGHIAYLLRQAAHAGRLRMERALAPLDLTPPQFAVLIMIAAYPGCSGADLARLTLLTPQTVSFIVGKLIAAGALSRSPHAVHGRVLRLEPSDAGRALLAAAGDRIVEVEAEMIAGLSAEEENVVRNWLAAMGAGAIEPG